MDWLNKHADTLAIITTIISGMLWMNAKFNTLEKDMAVMKTVMIMKNIMPSELAIKDMNH